MISSAIFSALLFAPVLVLSHGFSTTVIVGNQPRYGGYVNDDATTDTTSSSQRGEVSCHEVPAGRGEMRLYTISDSGPPTPPNGTRVGAGPVRDSQGDAVLQKYEDEEGVFGYRLRSLLWNVRVSLWGLGGGRKGMRVFILGEGSIILWVAETHLTEPSCMYRHIEVDNIFDEPYCLSASELGKDGFMVSKPCSFGDDQSQLAQFWV